jgi:drug/metabolite transporter (DMT)-like permease
MSPPAIRALAPARTLLLTALAMLAFAANSLLCRQALGSGLIDAASFTAVRLLAGAVVLASILLPRWRAQGRTRTDWPAALLLFGYMAFFSFAYLSLSAGTGALLLFGAVQLTMFAVALRRGERFAPLAWAGLALAFGGLVYLVAPGLTAPNPLGALLMAIAGVAWGGYSLRGRAATDPLAATANNFIAALPFALLVSLLFIGQLALTWPGLVLAVASGALASGLGYVIWYAALRGLAASSAATVQLSVPVIAAIGGVLLLSEPVTLRLVLASAATLGGIALALSRRRVDRRAA